MTHPSFLRSCPPHLVGRVNPRAMLYVGGDEAGEWVWWLAREWHG
jgi:hypothetical protein